METTTKRVIHGLVLTIMAPLAACELVARRIAGRDFFFSAHAQCISLLPGRTGRLLRAAYYHWTLRRCPMSVDIAFGAVLTHSEAELGQRVYIGSYSSVGIAIIGDHVLISDSVHLLSGSNQHGTASGHLYQEQEGVFATVHIGRNCWIGTNSVIMADVGADSIIGAASVVTRPIPPNSRAVGAPARVISQVDPESRVIVEDARHHS